MVSIDIVCDGRLIFSTSRPEEVEPFDLTIREGDIIKIDVDTVGCNLSNNATFSIIDYDSNSVTVALPFAQNRKLW